MLNKSQETHWAYWGVGTLCSLIAVGTSPGEVELHGCLGIVTFLFYWGLLSVEKNRPLAARKFSDIAP